MGALVGTVVLRVSVYLWSFGRLGNLVQSVVGTPFYGRLDHFKDLRLCPLRSRLGVIFARLFKTRPVLCAFEAMTIALVIAYAETFRTPELLLPTARMTLELIVAFLIGPPFIVYVLNRLRSNNRFERSPAASSLSDEGS